MPAAGRASFAAAHRVIHRVHRHRPNARAPSHPAHPTGLADGYLLVVGVADGADGGPAPDFHALEEERGVFGAQLTRIRVAKALGFAGLVELGIETRQLLQV